MDAARLLYGELDLDATSALFAVGQLDEGFDILADNINNSQESLNSISSSFSSFSEMADESTGVMKSFYETLDEISSLTAVDIFVMLAAIILDMISSTESFQKVLAELQKAFDPLLKVIAEFGEFIGKYIADVLLVAIGYLSTFIKYLTKTEQGLALLKTAAIFTGIAITIALFPALKALAVAAYGALTALGALLVPLLPYIAIGAAVAAALTAVVLVLEDLYYFATGGKESAAGDFFESMGMSKKEIEEIRKSIKDFIDSIKAAWDSLVNGVLKLVPQFKKIFNIIMEIVKDFFKATFAFVLDMAKVFSGVWDIIKGIFTGNFDLILNGFSKIGDGIMGIFKTMGNFIIKIFDNILEMMNPIKEIASTIFGGKPAEVKVKGEIETPKKENATQPNTTQVLPIAGQRASGGSVDAGKTYIVNERGTEAFIPKTDGLIIPNESINNSSNQSTMKTTIQSIIGAVNITIQSTENLQSDLSERIKEIIRQASIEAAQELGIVL
jgi:hypothetical protein